MRDAGCSAGTVAAASTGTRRDALATVPWRYPVPDLGGAGARPLDRRELGLGLLRAGGDVRLDDGVEQDRLHRRGRRGAEDRRDPVVVDAGGAERLGEGVDAVGEGVDGCHPSKVLHGARDSYAYGCERRAQRFSSSVDTGSVVALAAKLIAPASNTFDPPGVS
jgi:hypothetical protein